MPTGPDERFFREEQDALQMAHYRIDALRAREELKVAIDWICTLSGLEPHTVNQKIAERLKQ